MRAPIRSPDGQHGVIIVHAFAHYHEADFVDDPEEIEQLVADGQGWRIVDAVRLSE
ncbi:hypothetical protein [Lichenicoccus sp.]|uniref:hypothetical protein n=1 Tax=Lichenicoccus sp. TaxID=2781899 RepID=UPI003D13BAC3